MIDFKITFSNFRSIMEPITLPFENRITFIVGPNNSGKSNILRFLAVLCNSATNGLDDVLDFPSETKEILLDFDFPKTLFEEALHDRKIATDFLKESKETKACLSATFSRSGLLFSTSQSAIFSLIPVRYFDRQGFGNDFGKTGSRDANLKDFFQSLKVESHFNGTIYLPNVRFITSDRKEPPQFSNEKFPGGIVSFGKTVDQLATMDRPDFPDLNLGDRLKLICDFMQHTLEKNEILLQVPTTKESIIISIDGVWRPISSLGTGVEQALMIGLASFGFPGKLVLIDEPELHLHPRAQKRMLGYLNNQEDTQFVIATHSAASIDAVPGDVIQVVHRDGQTVGKLIRSSRERFQAVRDLGHSLSELVQTRFAIWVEGPSDRIYLNHWIEQIDPDLEEGVDYSILFYGGRILSHHGFDDVEGDLVRALSLSRNFAVVIDSDRKNARARINATKSRVKKETETQSGFCWITKGREIENYLNQNVLKTLSGKFNGIHANAGQYGKILNPDKINKVAFARQAIQEASEWPLDLRQRVNALVKHIKAAH